MQHTVGDFLYPNFIDNVKTHALEAHMYSEQIWKVWDALTDDEKNTRWGKSLKILAMDAETKASKWYQNTVLPEEDTLPLYEIGHIEIPSVIAETLPQLPAMSMEVEKRRAELLYAGYRDVNDRVCAAVARELNPHLMVGGKLHW